ncbi:MAG: DUF3368 domain-containing protein [Candidatus Caenarcaniphilales bacterium]|nr:DUF3368 domain-containing protein [Candidatus Caenarcaniphilales bacterium]
MIIIDTASLIPLENSNSLFILKALFETIFITPQIEVEFGKPIPDWIKVESIDTNDVGFKVLIQILGIGEASAIQLALNHAKNSPLLILDDKKARNCAKSLNLKISGTLLCLVQAKERKIISSVKDKINELRRVGFYISNKLEEEILKLAKEN